MEEEEELSSEQLALVEIFETFHGSGDAIYWLKVKRAYLCFNFTSTLTLSPSDLLTFSLSPFHSSFLKFIFFFSFFKKQHVGWSSVEEASYAKVDHDEKGKGDDDDDESREENPFKDFENFVQQVTRTFFFFLLLTQLSF